MATPSLLQAPAGTAAPNLSQGPQMTTGLAQMFPGAGTSLSSFNPTATTKMGTQAKTPYQNVSQPATTIASQYQAAPVQYNASSANGNSFPTTSTQPASPPTTGTQGTSATATGSTPTTYPGIIGALTGSSLAGSPAAQTYTGQTAQYGAGDIPIGQTAAQIGQNYGQQIAQVGNLGAGQVAGDLSTGTSPVGMGNANLASQAESARISALGTAENAALAGTGQQLTAQQQAASATNEAAGQAYTGQGLTQSGLTSAEASTAPTVGTAGQAQYSPLQAGVNGSTSGATAQVTPAQAAQNVNSGLWSPDQATSALGYLGPSAQSQLYSAMGAVNPTFNWNQATTNATVQGTLVPAMANATAQLQNLQTTLQNAPATAQTAIPVLNSLIQALGTNFGVQGGSTQQIQSAITDARAAMANALGAANNATPTAYDGYVQTLIPDGATLQQVTNGIQQFDQQMAGKLSAYSSPGTTTGAGSTSSGSSSLYDF